MITIADKQAERDRYCWWCWCWCWWSWRWWSWRWYPTPTSSLRGTPIAGGDNHDGDENDRHHRQAGWQMSLILKSLQDKMSSKDILCQVLLRPLLLPLTRSYIFWTWKQLQLKQSSTAKQSHHLSSRRRRRRRRRRHLPSSEPRSTLPPVSRRPAQRVHRLHRCAQIFSNNICENIWDGFENIWDRVWFVNMQLALHECTHAIFVISCEGGTTVPKMWNRQKKNGAGVLGGLALMGLNASSMFISWAEFLWTSVCLYLKAMSEILVYHTPNDQYQYDLGSLGPA